MKGKIVAPSNSFSFVEYEAFSKPLDVKTNNYSTVVLTKKDKTSNWLNPKTKETDANYGIVSTLRWFKNKINYWLYFDKTHEFFDVNLSEVPYALKNIKPDNNYSNYIFYINFLNDSVCQISHTFSDIVFYLCIDKDNMAYFTKDPTDDNDKFFYNIQDSLIKLTKYNKDGDFKILRN